MEAIKTNKKKKKKIRGKKGYSAFAKGLMISPSKVRPLAKHLRNKPYAECMSALEFVPNKAAKFLRKLIQSAAANVMVQNKNIDESMLYIKQLLVNDGPRQKRLWARGRGRANMLIRRSTHITVRLDELNKTGA